MTKATACSKMQFRFCQFLVVLCATLTSCGSPPPVIESDSTVIGDNDVTTCAVAAELREEDRVLGSVFTEGVRLRDEGAVRVRHLLGTLRLNARNERSPAIDIIEPITFALEQADLKDVLLVREQALAVRLSKALEEECGVALDPEGALLRPTRYLGP